LAPVYSIWLFHLPKMISIVLSNSDICLFYQTFYYMLIKNDEFHPIAFLLSKPFFHFFNFGTENIGLYSVEMSHMINYLIINEKLGGQSTFKCFINLEVQGKYLIALVQIYLLSPIYPILFRQL
jgi:hypothetical protein